MLPSLAWAARSQPPKALLINLPRHQERFESVKHQLELRGVTYERAPAVDGALLQPSDLASNVTAFGRALSA